jgi:chromosome segregation ATPase
MEAAMNQKADELVARTVAHDTLSDQVTKLTNENARLASDLEAAAQSHAEETKKFQDCLSTANLEIDSLRRSDDTERQLADLRSEHSVALEAVRADLSRALERATATDVCLRQAADAREQIEQELARIREEHAQRIDGLNNDAQATLALRTELSGLRAHHEARLTETKEAANLASVRMGELEASLHEAERLRVELQERYDQNEQNLRASLDELEASNAVLRAENEAKTSQLDKLTTSDMHWAKKLQESQDIIMRLSSEANQLQIAQESLNAAIIEKWVHSGHHVASLIAF